MKNIKIDLYNYLEKIPLLEILNENDMIEISGFFREKKYKKGVSIFREGDSGDDLFIIKEGAIKIYREDQYDGKEIILSILKEGDYFGEMAVLQPGLYRSANAATLEASVLYSLRSADFVEIVEKKPHISAKLLTVSLIRLRKANNKIEDLITLNARSRIIKTLIDLIEEHGTKEEGEKIIIDLKLTHQQIADMTGTVRETVTKVLTELQKKEVVIIKEKKIIIKKLRYLYGELNIEEEFR